MPRIIRRPRAELDLIDIWHYIATESSPERADGVYDRIEQAIKTLAEYPGMGRSRDELLPDLRSYPVGRYVVYFFPLDDGIRVARILHGSRDIPAIFEDENAEDDEQT